MEKNRYVFKALIYPCDDVYEAYIPLLDSHTYGEDITDAVYMAQDLVEVLVSYYVEKGVKVPQEDLSDIGACEVPDGGCVVVLFTDGLVPEVEDMTVQDAADILGVSRSRIYAMCADGTLESHKLGNAVMVYTKSVKERQNSGVKPGRPKKELAMA